MEMEFECEKCKFYWIGEKIKNCPRCESIFTSTVEYSQSEE